MNHVQIRSLPMGQRALDALSYEQRKSMVESKEAVEFFTRLRQMKGEQRAVSGAELSIPVVFLELISENMYRYSKLLRRVRVRNVDGETRQTIAGTVPEAVWTEMCGAINELSFGFNQVTLDGYKVAGFVPVCNSILEDNDINLAGWIVERLSCTAKALQTKCRSVSLPVWRRPRSRQIIRQKPRNGWTCTQAIS